MATFDITRPDGSVWEVDANSPEEAHKMLNDKLQGERNVKEQQEFKDLPTWQKPLKAADDLARTTADFFTAGMLDRLLGGENVAKTEAARSRAGGADIAANVVGGVAAIPSAVPRVIGAVGGGPLARGIVGTGVAAGEGALQGGIQAAGHERDIGPEVAGGAVLGGLGQATAGVMSAPVNWLGKQMGINALPKATQIPKGVSIASAPPFQRVEHAAARAGDNAANVQREFKRVSPAGMSETEVSLLRQVQHGDPGTKAARAIRDLMEGRVGQALTGGGLIGGITSGNLPLMAASVAPLAVGPLAGKSAGMGTKEAADALRRAMRGKPKYEGILSPDAQSRIGRGLRTQWMEEEERY